jgi:mutual gliding-motility protein MglA
MVLFNYSTKELTAKVVYYGPGLCGKTTNLQWIHEKLPIKNKGKMLSLATETDRTLFFDFLPIEIGTIRGMKTRIQLYTVPGQVFYNATRRMVLKGADCLVFVCDSQEPMLDANLESFENMRQNLEANEIDPGEIPLVFQYNKRDLPNALPLEIINERMNPGEQPFFEAVAVKGVGVEETLKGVTKLVFKSLSVKYGTDSAAAAAAPPAPAPAPAPAPTPTPAPMASPRPAPAPALALAPEPPPAPTKAATTTIPPGSGRRPLQHPEDLLDELDLEPAPELVAPAGPAPVPRPRTTLVTGKNEADDLRRRIGMPAELDVSLEEIDEEGEDLEEIALEESPFRGGAPAPFPPHAPPTPARTPLRPGPTPSSVTVEIAPGQTEAMVPIEIALEPGSGPVTLNLRLVLKPRR